ncbi:MAG: hypothetical protein ACI4RP_06805, partial [Acutalibacteraceae bacterium]
VFGEKSCRPRATDEGMPEPMNALDSLSRANPPHPSATLTPSPPRGRLISLRTLFISKNSKLKTKKTKRRTK